ncbi:MAG: leucine--tRNA ligase [Flavobacteriales bacterium]|nr:leucine--tRNA ligase [Flavobacteriales bacterium]
MDYPFEAFEKKWQAYWECEKTFKAHNDSNLPKYYVLDMFPYPSGAGLHVGHPLGYIASDIVARYKRLNGFNVLHPMGFDAFGLPAEQYAIQTGRHPAETTEQNINRYISQLKHIGFAYDWDRMVNTSDPNYYKWTQWIFLQLYQHWYDHRQKKARPIFELIHHFETLGNADCQQPALSGNVEGINQIFSADEWKSYSEQTKQSILMNYRLAYQGFAYVNWCENLGTVLANDEVKDGVSERGGHPVVRRQMRQWFLRVTDYADRLHDDLAQLDWPESMKEMQRNWIGRSEGVLLDFAIKGITEKIDVFTTRPDTIFGVSFICIAPESDWVKRLTTSDRMADLTAYVAEAGNRSERERQTDVKRVSGVFTGTYALHPFTGEEIPIWVADYVLAGYGTGAVMGVPAHDARDFRFAAHFQLPIHQVITDPTIQTPLQEAYEEKRGTLIHSDFLNGLSVQQALKTAAQRMEEQGLGQRQTHYRLRDANFSRQRYWGEPFPVYYHDQMATAIAEADLPLMLPKMDDFKPTGNPEGPLAKLKDWTYNNYPIETDTMPGFAGSSWYFLRYMDPQNTACFASKEALQYWQDVDMYIGGTEHAVGHLLYSRFWHKFLFDLGYVPTSEPFKKLINQGMIQGVSAFIYLLATGIDNTDASTENRKDTDAIPPFIVTQKLKKHIEAGLLSNEQKQALNIILNVSAVHGNVHYLTNNNLPLIYKRNIPIEFVSESAENGLEKDELMIAAFRSDPANTEFKEAIFIDLADGVIQSLQAPYICLREVEKMSKSKWNVVNPDQICKDYGADTLRMYEMFLGPIEQSKPWNMQGIEGVHKFLRKLWRLVISQDDQVLLSDDEPEKAAYKALHKLIKKVTEDIEALSFNTCISAFMICLNDLQELGCRKRKILEPFLIILSPFAPHIAEELWSRFGHTDSIAHATFPVFNPEYLTENTFTYPVSFNGKVRFQIDMPKDASKEAVEAATLTHASAIKWLEGRTPKKVIVVPGRIVNIVL